jgi:hypothetical protein
MEGDSDREVYAKRVDEVFLDTSGTLDFATKLPSMKT